jgi:hypothetical protein
LSDRIRLRQGYGGQVERELESRELRTKNH